MFATGRVSPVLRAGCAQLEGGWMQARREPTVLTMHQCSSRGHISHLQNCVEAAGLWLLLVVDVNLLPGSTPMAGV
jgi:hypothetical protein